MTDATPRSRATVTRRQMLLGAAVAGLIAGCGSRLNLAAATPTAEAKDFDVHYDDAQWRQRLTPEQYDVLRKAGTEAPFSSPLDDEHRAGVFGCAGCQLDLFSSATKFDSGTGWPSFYQPLDAAVVQRSDSTFGMTRTEVLCRQCGGHLGHVFDDGPKPTGMRYCMNGVALDFRPA